MMAWLSLETLLDCNGRPLDQVQTTVLHYSGAYLMDELRHVRKFSGVRFNRDASSDSIFLVCDCAASAWGWLSTAWWLLLCGSHINQMILSASELSSTNYIFIPSMLFSKLQCNYNPWHAKIKPGNIHLNIQRTSVDYHYCLLLIRPIFSGVC